MKANPNPDPATRNPTASKATAPGNAGNGYAPSVPISVYRELAAELQATRAMLDSLHAQNQDLARQNQIMRQEMERVIQTTLNLRQFTDIPQPNLSSPPSSVPVANPSVKTPEPIGLHQPTATSQPEAMNLAAQLRSPHPNFQPDELFTEQPEKPTRLESKADASKDVGSLWLTITIIAIIITAFGAGFLVVRPLLPSR